MVFCYGDSVNKGSLEFEGLIKETAKKTEERICIYYETHCLPNIYKTLY